MLNGPLGLFEFLKPVVNLVGHLALQLVRFDGEIVGFVADAKLLNDFLLRNQGAFLRHECLLIIE